MANRELISAIEEIEKLKGVPKIKLIEGIKKGLAYAYRKNYGANENLFVEISEKTGEMQLRTLKTVVEEVVDPSTEISLKEALNLDPNNTIGNTIEVTIPTPQDFGRIAIQVARQVISQTVREGEREAIINNFSTKEGDIVTGNVWRWDEKGIYIKFSVGEGMLPPKEQGSEKYRMGERLVVYVTKLDRTTKDPIIVVSRSSPHLLRKLLELEVPEINQGLIEIVNIVREAGSRSKVAVRSKDERIEPVGICIGTKGYRIQNVIRELKGERVDIVRWSSDLKTYITNALSPAKINSVEISEIINDDGIREKVAKVEVANVGNAKSIAIGIKGQNVRLAAKLTGTRIDIVESE